MPQDRFVPGSAEDWLSRARGDLAIAKAPLPEGAFFEDLCFHAQQAAEKALKAVYQQHGWGFRYTHDLEELIAGLKEKGLELPTDVVEADVLTGFAWESRYPGLGEPVSKGEYEEAVRQAETVVAWAEREIKP
jgi:HEPN domain-containing protein